MLVVPARVGVMSGRRARGSVTSVGGGGDGPVFGVLYGSGMAPDDATGPGW